eukprot:scaffold938_cov334-Pavlova_lutheri.AAC.21
MEPLIGLRGKITAVKWLLEFASGLGCEGGLRGAKENPLLAGFYHACLPICRYSIEVATRYPLTPNAPLL